MLWRFDQILFDNSSFLGNVARFPFYLLSIPYGWAVRSRSLLYECGLKNSRRLPCPVISIGNITVGGTGKTPLVMTLAERLKEEGIRVAVLSRGYKGKRRGQSLVSDGQSIFLTTEESGDEPYLMAKVLRGIPVLVGKDRYATGRFAIQQWQVAGLLLDDGYQHLQLHRDLNIVLVDSSLGFGNGHLLPRGILREPLGHLRRADLFLMTKAEEGEQREALEARLKQLHPQAPIFHAHYEPLGLIGPSGEWESLSSLRGKKVLAFCGIANPESFISLLKKCGMRVIKEEIFPDHHAYTAEDLAVLREKSEGAEWVVTTEKDLVRLETIRFPPLPIRALRIRLKVWEEAFFEKIMQLFSHPGGKIR